MQLLRPFAHPDRTSIDGTGRRASEARVLRSGQVQDTDKIRLIAVVLVVLRLVFERAPETFKKDIAHAPAPAVHGDFNAGVLNTLVKSALVN